VHDEHDGNEGHQPLPLRFTLTAQTSKAGVPQANLLFPQGIKGVADDKLLIGFEIHRLFIKDESHEVVTTGMDDGGCEEGDDGCDDDHGEMVGAGMHGFGTLADGTQVRVHIDLQGRGLGQDVDRFRIRWRENMDHDSGQDESLVDITATVGGCADDAG
jgi:hypothetical protein